MKHVLDYYSPQRRHPALRVILWSLVGVFVIALSVWAFQTTRQPRPIMWIQDSTTQSIPPTTQR